MQLDSNILKMDAITVILVVIAATIIAFYVPSMFATVQTALYPPKTPAPPFNFCKLGTNATIGPGIFTNTTTGFQVLSDQPAVLVNCNWAGVYVSGSKVSGTIGSPVNRFFAYVPANATGWVNLAFSPCGSTNGSYFNETISVDTVTISNTITRCV